MALVQVASPMEPHVLEHLGRSAGNHQVRIQTRRSYEHCPRMAQPFIQLRASLSSYCAAVRASVRVRSYEQEFSCLATETLCRVAQNRVFWYAIGHDKVFLHFRSIRATKTHRVPNGTNARSTHVCL